MVKNDWSCLACVLGPTGEGVPRQRLQLEDVQDFKQTRFMESYESRHSDFSFTAAVAKDLGVTQPPLRMDSQVKYGAHVRCPEAFLYRVLHAAWGIFL